MTIDLTLIIAIIIAIVIIYLLIKFIVSPLLRIIFGIIALLILIYILQRIFGFDIGQILAPFGISINFDKFSSNFNWLLTPINNFVDKAKDFWNIIWRNVPK